MASFDPMAGSQIDVDPSLKPKPSKELAARRQQLIEMFMQKGATPEQAAQEADAYLARYPAATGQSQPTAPAPAPAAPKSPQESMEADLYAQGYSADEARKQAQMQAEMRAEREREQLEQDLSQGGYGQRRVPSPRGLDGRSTQGTPFTSVKEGQAYNSRPVGEDGTVGKSTRDEDMRARGYEVVVGPDGQASYMVAYEDGFTGGPGRAGARPDLTESGKYEPTIRRGLNDRGVKVLAPTEDFRKRLAAREEDLRIDRIGEDSGIGTTAARAAYAEGGMDAVRRAARAGRSDDKAERLKRFQAQIQLGGGRLSPQAIQLETMLNDMTPEQRQQAMRYMVPGGQFAAGVDAQNMQNANDVIKRFMTSGAANMQNNPLAQTQAQLAQQQVDAAKPVQVRAQEQVAAGNFNHPDVSAHADAIVHSQFSSRPGMLGISSDFTDNEVAIAAQRLADDTGMDIAEAEKIMLRIQADRRRNSVASSIIGSFYDQ